MVRIYVDVGMTSEHNEMQALGLPDLAPTSWSENICLLSYERLLRSRGSLLFIVSLVNYFSSYLLFFFLLLIV